VAFPHPRGRRHTPRTPAPAEHTAWRARAACRPHWIATLLTRCDRCLGSRGYRHSPAGPAPAVRSAAMAVAAALRALTATCTATLVAAAATVYEAMAHLPAAAATATAPDEVPQTVLPTRLPLLSLRRHRLARRRRLCRPRWRAVARRGAPAAATASTRLHSRMRRLKRRWAHSAHQARLLSHWVPHHRLRGAARLRPPHNTHLRRL